MSIGLTHLGASLMAQALAAAPSARAGGMAEVAAHRVREGQALVVQVKADATEIRREVLAERGLDVVTLLRLTPQARIRTEVAIAAETAARQAQAKATGHFVDLRV